MKCPTDKKSYEIKYAAGKIVMKEMRRRQNLWNKLN